MGKLSYTMDTFFRYPQSKELNAKEVFAEQLYFLLSLALQ